MEWTKLTFIFVVSMNFNLTIMAQTTENRDSGYREPGIQTETKRFCLTLDLKEDPDLIREYEKWHQPDKIWAEIPRGIREAGILDMEIYRSGTHLFMIMTVPVDFDFDVQMTKLSTLPRQPEWEEMMAKYQQAVPGSSSAERWSKMERIFKLP